MSFRSALSHRGFRFLWLSQLVSRIGDAIHEVALVWLVYEVTGDPGLLSLTLIASFVPTSVLSLPAGAVVDRVNRKRLLVGIDLLRAGIVLAIPLVGPGPLIVPIVIVIAFVTGAADAFFRPAESAMRPNLVPEEDLESANSLMQITSSFSQILFALGGLVVFAVGSFSAFYVDAGSFLLSGLFLLGVPSDRVTRDAAERETGSLRSTVRSGLDDVRDGLAFVRGNRVLPVIIVVGASLDVALAPVNVAIPGFAASLPVSGSLGVGLLYSALFGGVTVGSVLVSRFDEFVDAYRGYVVTFGTLVFGSLLALGPLAAGVLPWPLVGVLVPFALAGIFMAAMQVPLSTLMHLVVPNEKMGRARSILRMASSLGFVVGLGVAGPAVGRFGEGAVIVGVGAAVALLGVGLALQPFVRLADITADAESGTSA